LTVATSARSTWVTTLADGRTMLLAFADPETWPDKKLVFVTGRVALDLVKSIPS
jgi:hypothetical protein